MSGFIARVQEREGRVSVRVRNTVNSVSLLLTLTFLPRSFTYKSKNLPVNKSGNLELHNLGLIVSVTAPGLTLGFQPLQRRRVNPDAVTTICPRVPSSRILRFIVILESKGKD